MMKKAYLFLPLLIMVMGTALVLAPIAQAEVLTRQRQSASSSFESECTGNCSFKSETSLSQSQSTFISDDGESHREHNNRKKPQTHRPNRDGKVEIHWDFRGDTCHIRYTEASSRNYRYSTSAACDDGRITIGGLVRGRSYRFQVKQGSGEWSRTITRIAQ